ncbi:LuxR C-terminal-related transcriptional regulator [Streptomyces sp. NBC_00669]|uniref:ATP-binding protein n=1 Tax=Streptomyces sp. NBC_00669 TaxID=2976011 RepID=UPI002E30D021|nr:LuxR C-terminal-related transcriptional regulator [Streptomyces sp. NBC_00669]
MKSESLATETSGDLLTPLSSFVGRVDEMVEASRLLRGTRLLTLTGTAGTGKTRLALEVARKEQRGGRQAIVVVELGACAGPESVASRVFAALHGRIDADTLFAEAKGPGVKLSGWLVVIDNCEHVIGECGLLVGRLLARYPGLQILATSREALRIPGETVYPVNGLPLPDPDGRPSAGEYLRSDAVRLFADRARAVVPDFALTQENAADTGAVCERLGGLPLPIELAAQLIRTFSVAELRKRLDDPLSLLVGGWRTASTRHRSWRAALTWSYDLLKPMEQLLFRRLSVFPGGFGVDAAVAVVTDEVPASSVPGLLTALESKSVIRSPAGLGREEAGAGRFHMLEPVRCYAHQQLRDLHEEEQAYEGLTRWLTALVSPLWRTGIASRETVRTAGAELANLRHALEGPTADADERRLLLVGGLVTLETDPDPDPEAGTDTARLVHGALRAAKPEARYRAIALEAAAMLAARRGAHREALHTMQEAVDRERASAPSPLLCRLLLRLSLLKEHAGDRSGALEDLTASVRAGEQLADEPTFAVCVGHLARHELVRGEPASAARLIDRALPAVPAVPPEWQCDIMHVAGALAVECDDLSTAERHFTAPLRSPAKRPGDAAGLIEGLAVVAVRRFQFERGLHLISAAEEMAESVTCGLRSHPWWRQRVEAARAAGINGLTSRADRELALGRSLRPDEVVAYALGDAPAAPPARDEARHGPLSPRQWAVAALLIQGLTNRQIASRIHVSVRTVETHVRNIRGTLGLRSRSHIAAWAAQAQQ